MMHGTRITLAKRGDLSMLRGNDDDELTCRMDTGDGYLFHESIARR